MKIKIATDFSKNAQNAYLYTQGLGKNLEATLSLVHVYSQPPIPINSDLLRSMPTPSELQKESLKKLKKFAKATPSVSLEVFASPVVETLIDLSYKSNLLVVGAKGEQGLIDKVFGSVSLSVSKKAHCPVLVVPPKIKYTGIKNILYATTKETMKQAYIERIALFAQKLGAKLHFVHVSESQGNLDMSEIDSIMKDINLPYEKADLDYISVRGAFDIYREKHNIDLIAIVTHQLSIWERLFHASYTEALEWNTEIPILVLHDVDNG